MSVGEQDGSAAGIAPAGQTLRRLSSIVASRGGRVAILLALLLVMALIGFQAGSVLIFDLDGILSLAVLASATGLLAGQVGLLSFGQAVFYGAGAYTLALGWLHYQLPFGVLMVMAPLVGALLALLVGAVALRTRGFFFALVTLAFSELASIAVEQAFTYTKGETGIFGAIVPSFLAEPVNGYLFTLALSVVAILVLYYVVHSPLGLTLRGIRDHEVRMKALGVNVYTHMLLAFVIAGAVSAVAGALFVVAEQAAYPTVFGWLQSGTPVFAAILGGASTFLGPIVGAVVIGYGSDVIEAQTTHWQLVLGAMLLIVVLFAPDGLVGALGALGRRLRARLGRRRT